MKIIGIDPGFDRLGVAILEKENGQEKLIFSCCILTDKKTPHSERLNILKKELGRILDKEKPSEAGVEKIFFTRNQKTAVGVAEARGIILAELGKHRIRVYEFSPPAIKLAVAGYGKASKAQVMLMVKTLLKLNKTPKYDDEGDAMAVALATSASLIHRKVVQTRQTF